MKPAVRHCASEGPLPALRKGEMSGVAGPRRPFAAVYQQVARGSDQAFGFFT